MNDFKAYASRAPTRAGFGDKVRNRWTRHGSTRYVNDERYLTEAIEYVLERQGEPMAVFDGRRADLPHEPRPSGSAGTSAP